MRVEVIVVTEQPGRRVWTLTRESADFTPLDFRQRFTGTFSDDGNTISGAWEKDLGGASWEHDFALTYRRTR